MKKNKTVVDVSSSFQSRIPTVQGCSAGKSAETLTMFWNDVREQLFRDFLGYEPKEKDRSYVEKTFISSDRLNACVITVLRRLVEIEKREGLRHKRTPTHTGEL